MSRQRPPPPPCRRAARPRPGRAAPASKSSAWVKRTSRRPRGRRPGTRGPPAAPGCAAEAPLDVSLQVGHPVPGLGLGDHPEADREEHPRREQGHDRLQQLAARRAERQDPLEHQPGQDPGRKRGEPAEVDVPARVGAPQLAQCREQRAHEQGRLDTFAEEDQGGGPKGATGGPAVGHLDEERVEGLGTCADLSPVPAGDGAAQVAEGRLDGRACRRRRAPAAAARGARSPGDRRRWPGDRRRPAARGERGHGPPGQLPARSARAAGGAAKAASRRANARAGVGDGLASARSASRISRSERDARSASVKATGPRASWPSWPSRNT